MDAGIPVVPSPYLEQMGSCLLRGPVAYFRSLSDIVRFPGGSYVSAGVGVGWA